MSPDSLALLESLPYCGAPAVPTDIAGRWNLDPWLIGVFVLAAVAYRRWLAQARGRVRGAQPACFALGWALALAAMVSPVCAWAVALLSVRVGQHMWLMLLAAPLLAAGLPARRDGAAALVPATGAFFVALWLWHLPAAYAWTLRSDLAYWLMQGNVLGAAIWFWHAVRQAGPAMPRIVAGVATGLHMGLLGALLTFAARPWYDAHLESAPAWGLTALADQQLAGLVMWVPGGLGLTAIALVGFAGWWRRAAAL